MEEKQVLVRIEDLCKYFRLSSKEELKAVDHVSFDIFRNETVGIVGESGLLPVTARCHAYTGKN